MIVSARFLLGVLIAALLLFGETQPSSAQVAAQKAPSNPTSQNYRSFEDWKAACAKLPPNRALKGSWPRRDLLPLRNLSEFEQVVTDFFNLCKTGTMSEAGNWVGQKPTEQQFFNTATAYFLRSRTAPNSPAIPFEPFAQKLSVPERTEIYLRADLHGDVRSLLANLTWLNTNGYLNGFTIAHTNFYMIFLGDYTDRGSYGIEVLYTLLRLKLANPEHVFLLRGNHEDLTLQSRYGFFEEGQRKYGREFQPQRVLRAYDFFPVVLYTGSDKDFIQCNHGGMEPGFSPHALLEAPGRTRFQFLGVLQQAKFLNEHPDWLTDDITRRTARQYLQDFRPESPTVPTVLGFLWNDFTVLPNEPQFILDPDRAFVHGQRSTEFILRAASTEGKKVHAVFRGHQHSPLPNPMMRRLVASKGIFRLWQTPDSPGLAEAPVNELSKVLEQDEVRSISPGSVWTFNVGADTIYGERCGFNFDAFGMMKVGRDLADWKLHVVNVPVSP